MGKNLKGKECGRGITQRKDGRWQGRYTNRFGKRKTLYADTYNEIVDKLREAEYKDGKQLNSIDDSITMDRWFEIWIETFKSKHCRNTTIATYERMYKYWISPEIGTMSLSKLTPIHLQRLVNKLQSQSMRELTRAILVNMFKYAVSSEIVAKNVARNLDIRNADDETKEPICLTDEELSTILKYSDGTLINDIFQFILQTGMRVGEVIGLTWGNVDYENNVIHVVQQAVTVKDPVTNKWVNEIHKPKTYAGIRDIPMTKDTRAILTKRRTKNNVISLPKDNEYVFGTRHGTPQFRATISKMSDMLRNRIQKDYPEFRNFSPHSFRHTFATRMIMAGVKPKVLQVILGHNQLQTTMDLYCHVYDEQIQEAMEIYEVAEMV